MDTQIAVAMATRQLGVLTEMTKQVQSPAIRFTVLKTRNLLVGHRNYENQFLFFAISEKN